MSAGPRAHVTVLYDGDCRFCKVCIAAVLRWDRRSLNLYPASIQSPEGQMLLASVAEPERLRTAHVVTANGTVLSGGEGAPALFAELPAGRPLARLLAAAMPATRVAYSFLTRLRTVIGPLLPNAWAIGAEGLIAERRRGIIPPTAAL